MEIVCNDTRPSEFGGVLTGLVLSVKSTNPHVYIYIDDPG